MMMKVVSGTKHSSVKDNVNKNSSLAVVPASCSQRALVAFFALVFLSASANLIIRTEYSRIPKEAVVQEQVRNKSSLDDSPHDEAAETPQDEATSTHSSRSSAIIPHDVNPYADWKAALRFLAAAGREIDDGGSTTNASSSIRSGGSTGAESFSFSGILDASRIAPVATFGTLLGTCASVFEESCDWYVASNTSQDFKEMLSSADQGKLNRARIWMSHLERGVDTPLSNADTENRRQPRNQTYYSLNGGSNIVWILAAHVAQVPDTIRMVEEGMKSRLRLYPNSTIILSDNQSPAANKLQELVKDLPGNHYFTSNPPPSGFEPGAYFGGLEKLAQVIPNPVEGEIVVFSQATTFLQRPLPLEPSALFKPNCEIRPLYPPFPRGYGIFATPPCNESQSVQWASNYTGDNMANCAGFCPAGKCQVEFTQHFGPYKHRICDQTPKPGIIHSSMVTTGNMARNILHRAFSYQFPCKASELISGYWMLAGTTEPGAQCEEPMDFEDGTDGILSYFLYKGHGHPGGWGQGEMHSYLNWIHELDNDGNGQVTMREMRSNRERLIESTRKMCQSTLEGFRGNLKKLLVASKWLDACAVWKEESSMQETAVAWNVKDGGESIMSVEETLIPHVCKAANSKACDVGTGNLGGFYQNS